MIEPFSVAFHAVEITPLSINDTAVVVGAGMIGLLVVQTLRLAGCGTIIAVDIDDGRLDLARELGADIGFRSDKTDVPAEVRKLTGNRGADIALEAVGNDATVNIGINSLRKNGILTLVGNFSPTVNLPLQDVVARQIKILGSYASCGEYPACLDIVNRGGINVDKLLSETAPLAEGEQWFKRLYDQQDNLMKVILVP